MNLNQDWMWMLGRTLMYGRDVSPRGQKIRELDQVTLQVDMLRPVITNPLRKLNYRFMMAEALWMCSGRNDLSSLVRYNPNMARFSDDGAVLAGAYGPRIMDQLGYVLNKLLEDRDTRQATMTLWQPNPPSSKDIPCTIAMDFKIRDNQLNMHVFMRSSDLWLGIPYDVFSFSMVATMITGMLNIHGMGLRPGTLFLTAASSHLYETHWETAKQIIDGPHFEPCRSMQKEFYTEEWLTTTLILAQDSKKGDKVRWWEHDQN